MSIDKNKHFKNKEHSRDSYYDCILACKINPCSSTWQGIEESCEAKCLNQQLKSHFM